MSAVQKNADPVSEKKVADMIQKAEAEIEEIHRAVLQIEGILDRLTRGGKSLAGADAAAPAVVSGALERLSPTLTEIRNLQEKTVVTLDAVSADVKELLRGRSGGLIDRLGPDGTR